MLHQTKCCMQNDYDLFARNTRGKSKNEHGL
jgi:hypothetical protein